MSNIEKYSINITEKPINSIESVNFVRLDSHGAIIIFDGITRDHTDNRKVLFLEYEAYLPMAEKKLETVAVEMCEKWDVLVSIEHRLGKVEIGESSLIVAVGSQHREKAYQASQYSVDRRQYRGPRLGQHFHEIEGRVSRPAKRNCHQTSKSIKGRTGRQRGTAIGPKTDRQSRGTYRISKRPARVEQAQQGGICQCDQSLQSRDQAGSEFCQPLRGVG